MGRMRAATCKVRTGCRTCKARRVKCDEAKPACRRCSSTGRDCGGYEVLPPKALTHGNAHKPLLPRQHPTANAAFSLPTFGMPTTIPGATNEENRYFSYFCRHTAPTIGGSFSAPLFERFIIQLSLREPMIRHAATALGALQRAQDRYSKIKLSHSEAGFALHQYGKALNLTRQKLMAPDLASQRLKLVVCILFVCYELAQNHFRETAMHLENGLYLLVHVRHKGQLPSNWETESSGMSDDAESLDCEIMQTFDRLDIQSTLIRSTRPKFAIDPTTVAKKTPRAFSSVSQAREYLRNLSRSVTAFRHQVRATPSPLSLEDEQQLKELQIQVRRQIQAWNSAFGSLRLPQVPLESKGTPPKDASARALLESISLVNGIMLETGVADGRECVFDNFTNDFRTIVELTRIVRDCPRDPGANTPSRGKSCFHVYMGCIPSVYLVAMKCRDPEIRRQAIEILESLPFREGMWDASVGARLCRHVMEVEEEGYPNLKDARDLPEKARVHEALFDVLEWDGEIPVHYKRRDFEGEYGSPGVWLSWTDKASIASPSSEGSESVWDCSEKTHRSLASTERCHGCNRLPQDVLFDEEDDIDFRHYERSTVDLGLEEDHRSNGNGSDGTNVSEPTEFALSPDLPQPGRGPPHQLLREQRARSCNAELSQEKTNRLFVHVSDPKHASDMSGSLSLSPDDLDFDY